MSTGIETTASVSIALCSCRSPGNAIPPTFLVFSLSSSSVSSETSTLDTLDVDDDDSIASLDIDIKDADLTKFKSSICPVSIPKTEQILPGSASHTLPSVIAALHQFEMDL